MSLWRKLMCRLGFHKSLDVIQSFGSAQHIGCRYCGREMAIHHGMQAVVAWAPDLAELYDSMGYETAKATEAWHRWRRNNAALPHKDPTHD